MSGTTPAEKIAQYIRLRDHIKAAQDEFEASLERPKAAMKKLEAELLEFLNANGSDNLAVKGVGTVYRTNRTSASVEDPAAFMAWVREHEMWDALDIKANKTFVAEQAEAGDLPPGVKFSVTQAINIRRS
jgi:hypothetical protein